MGVMSRRRVSARSVAVFACLAAGLAGCSSDPTADASQASTDEDMTPRALAAAVAAQLPDFDLVSAHPDRGGDADEEDALRVDLEFQASDGRRSSITVVATDDVGDFPGRRPCEAHSDVLDGCVDAAGPDGTRSILLWQDREPEEDPGIIDVLSVRPEADVWAGYDQDARGRGRSPRSRPAPPRGGPARSRVGPVGRARRQPRAAPGRRRAHGLAGLIRRTTVRSRG